MQKSDRLKRTLLRRTLCRLFACDASLAPRKLANWSLIVICFLFAVLCRPVCADPAYDDYVRGQHCIMNGEWNRAAAVLTRAIAAEPKFLNAYIARAFVESRQGKFELALKDYDRVLALAPQNAVALADKGFCLYKFGKLDEALSYLNKAHDLDPLRGDFLANRAEVLLKMGRLENAIADCTSSVAFDDSDADAYITRADAFALQNKIKEAIQDYSKAISLNPDPVHMFHEEGESYFKRAQLYSKIGKQALAERDYQTCRSIGYNPHGENQSHTGTESGNERNSLPEPAKSVQVDPVR